MKTLKNVLFILLVTILVMSASAQDCGYYSFTEGMVLGYQNLDGKGKVSGSTRTTCLNVTNNGGVVLYNIKSEYADAKNSNPAVHEFTMRCEDGKFYMDMQSFIDPKSMDGFKDLEISVDGNDMMYPSSLSAGEILPDANITISAGSGGTTIMNMVVNVTNRKVIGNETVTVPAGTFDCVKITYDVETKLMFKVNTAVTEYINMGIGNVKTETFDKKGKLLGSAVLTEVKR